MIPSRALNFFRYSSFTHSVTVFIIFFIVPQILGSFPELATGRSCHENSEFLRQLAVKRSSFCYNGATIENSRSQ